MRIRKIKFDDGLIPAWTYEGKEPSIYTFVETLALAGLEGKHIRLSASLQRRLLGYAVFGKQEFMLSKEGYIYVWASQAFGQDSECQRFPASYAGVAAKRSEKLHAKYFGKGYFSAYAHENSEL